MAWYQCIYFYLKLVFCFFINFKNIIYFLLFFIFFNFFIITEIAQCLKINKFDTNYLNKVLVGNNNVYFYKNITYDIISNIMFNIKFVPNNNLNFNVLSFKDKNGSIFPYNHPYSHPHINFMYNYNQFNDIYVTLELSSSNYNNFKVLCNEGINIKNTQFVSNNFYMCSKKDMISKIYDSNNSLYFINENNIQIIKHFNLVKKSY